MTDPGLAEAGDARAAPTSVHHPYISAAEYARVHGVHRQTVTFWFRAGLLEGAYKSGSRVLVPSDCPEPPVNVSMPYNRGRKRAAAAPTEAGRA